MKRLKTGLYSAALLLTGCASSVPLSGEDQAGVSGTLSLDWVQPHAIEIQLDGETYAGEWTSSVCKTDACRGKFRNVLKIHRRHIHRGEAVLTAKSGVRMNCEWVSHLPEVDGQCRMQDGRLFKLKASKTTAS
jgi:hypothetical protein